MRIDLKQALVQYLTDAIESDYWTELSRLSFVSEGEVMQTVALLISIDSSCGTTKFMTKFLRRGGGQNVNDIILLAEAHGLSENLRNYLVFWVL